MDDEVLRTSSTWNADQVEQFLADAMIPIRLAVANDDRIPLVCSLWYYYEEGRLHCATQRSSKLASLLERAETVGFEVAGDDMPYRGVRGQGRVQLSLEDGQRVLGRLMTRYLDDQETSFARWLEARSADEVAIIITPNWLTSWDFSARMTTTSR